jgi:hypothetical protein
MICVWMTQSMRVLHPNVLFKAGRTWAAKFVHRNNLVPRRPTNSKAKSVQERVPAVQSFHGNFERWVRSRPTKPGAPFDPHFGRVVRSKRFNVDQSPLTLDSKGKVTYERRGADTVRIVARAGDDKRCATLTVMVRLYGDGTMAVRQPFPSIIFKGKGLRRCKEEKEEMARRAPDVFVQFQPKAWTDSETLYDYMSHFFKWLDENDPDPSGENVLFMDNLGSQVSVHVCLCACVHVYVLTTRTPPR